MLRSTLPFSLIMLLAIASGNGCTHANWRQSWRNPALISPDRLPAGWTLLPPSELPPIDKTPWWTQNPLLLRGDKAKQITTGDEPAAPCEVWAVIYAKHDERIVFLVVTYRTQAEADAVAKWVAEKASAEGVSRPEETFWGMSRYRSYTINSMSISSDSPDRDFFINHFKAITDVQPSPASAPVPVR